jgi:hypothetical protein
VEVKIPKGFEMTKVDRLIERLCREEGLTRKIKRMLKKGYPSSSHWHYNRGDEKGTLEITLFRKESRILFSVHDNRKGIWTHEYADKLATATRRALLNSKRR